MFSIVKTECSNLPNVLGEYKTYKELREALCRIADSATSKEGLLTIISVDMGETENKYLHAFMVSCNHDSIDLRGYVEYYLNFLESTPEDENKDSTLKRYRHLLKLIVETS